MNVPRNLVHVMFKKFEFKILCFKKLYTHNNTIQSNHFRIEVHIRLILDSI